jgi:TRAP-type mannitol/chloroaromatic compound transport system permease small subunit
MVDQVLLVIRSIDRSTNITARAISWLCLVMVVMVVMVLRYYFQSESIALPEAITYIHGLVFILGIASTLLRGGHIRMDIFYRGFTVN